MVDGAHHSVGRQAGRSAGCMCNLEHAGLKMESLVVVEVAVETAWLEAGFCLGIKNQDIKKRF